MIISGLALFGAGYINIMSLRGHYDFFYLTSPSSMHYIMVVILVTDDVPVI